MKVWQKIIVSIGLATCIGMCGAWVVMAAQNFSKQSRIREQLDIGERYLNELEYEQAIVAYNNAVEIDAKNPSPYVERARACLWIVEEVLMPPEGIIISEWTDEMVALYKQAENDYMRAIGLDKKRLQIYLELAGLYINRGDMQKAQDILELAYQQTGDPTAVEWQEELENGSVPVLPEEQESLLDVILDALDGNAQKELENSGSVLEEGLVDRLFGQYLQPQWWIGQLLGYEKILQMDFERWFQQFLTEYLGKWNVYEYVRLIEVLIE